MSTRQLGDLKMGKKHLILALIIILIAALITGLIFFNNNKVKKQIGLPTIDFGYELDDEVLTIVEVTPEEIQDIRIYAYDFNLTSGQPLGTVEIIIPYDDEGLDQEEEEGSVTAKYLNEETNDWEDVFYAVDAEKNEVKILTNHLSTYAVFVITNPDKRNAYVSEIHNYNICMDQDTALRILTLYGERKVGWEAEVFNATTEALNSKTMFGISAVSTLGTLGGAYDSLISKNLNNFVTNLGVAAACAQLVNNSYNYGFTSKDSAVTAAKSTLNIAAAYGTPAIQIAYVGVGIIDIALTEVTTFANANKYKSTKNMYDAYYNRPENKRDIAAWVKLFEKIYKDNKANPIETIRLMKKEIDDYVVRYWEVAESDYESWIDSYDKNGSLAKYPWPTKKDRENISNIHKKNLYSYLESTFNVMSKNMYLDLLTERAKQHENLKNYYNQEFTITLKENVKKEATYANYYARFISVSQSADINSWTFKLDEEGSGKITFTLLGHQNAGFPTEIALYKDGDAISNNRKTITLSLKAFTSNSQTINFDSKVEEEPEDPEEPEGAEELEDPEGAKGPEKPEESEEPEESQESQVEKDPPKVVQESNPYYKIIVRSSSDGREYAGWYAVLGYTNDSSPDLESNFKIFEGIGEVEFYYQESDLRHEDVKREIWIYDAYSDLINKKAPYKIVKFSLSGSYIGMVGKENLYEIKLKISPPPENPEDASGKYQAYLIEESGILIVDSHGLEIPHNNRYSNYEKPSAIISLYDSGTNITVINHSNPIQGLEGAMTFESIGGNRYRHVSENGFTYTLEITIPGSTALYTFFAPNYLSYINFKNVYYLEVIVD